MPFCSDGGIDLLQRFVEDGGFGVSGVEAISSAENKARGRCGKEGWLQDWVFFFKDFARDGRERVRFVGVIFFLSFVHLGFVWFV